MFLLKKLITIVIGNKMITTTRFYEQNYPDFFDGWSPDHLHYGLWFDDTKTHEESLLNLSREVSNKLDINNGDIILDAGCGVGGTSRYIAENFDVSVIGILLSPTLCTTARQLSEQSDYKHRLTFHLMDYTKTDFNNETFNRVLAIESVCHADDKNLFIKEAFRILKPSGRLVVSDFFLLRNPDNDKEHSYYRRWCDGWAMPAFDHINDFKKKLVDNGFENITCDDYTRYALKSAQIMKNQAYDRLPLTFIQHHQGKIPETRLAHVLATYWQDDCLESGLCGHLMFAADKR